MCKTRGLKWNRAQCKFDFLIFKTLKRPIHNMLNLTLHSFMNWETRFQWESTIITPLRRHSQVTPRFSHLFWCKTMSHFQHFHITTCRRLLLKPRSNMVHGSGFSFERGLRACWAWIHEPWINMTTLSLQNIPLVQWFSYNIWCSCFAAALMCVTMHLLEESIYLRR